jgi:TolA-binding protein
VLKEYPRTLVIPEALYKLAEVNFLDGRNADAVALLRQLASEYAHTEWGRRAVQRLRAQR